MPALVALEKYTDADVRQRRDEVASQQYQIWARLGIVDRQLRQVRRRSKGSVSKEELELRDQAEELTEKKEWADLEYEVTYKGVISNFYAKLQDGILIARGLALPHQPGRPPIEIPSVEWSFLRFDDSLEVASGQGISYRVVALRRA